MRLLVLALLLWAQGAQAGLIESDNGGGSDLTGNDPATVSSLTVNGVSQFNGDITVGAGVEVAGPFTVSSITVNGTSQLNGAVTLGAGVTVAGPVSVSSITVNGTSQLNGNVTMGAGTNIAGPLTASSITVNGVARVNGALTITSTTIVGTITGPAIFSEGIFDPDAHADKIIIGQIVSAETDGDGICVKQNGDGDVGCWKLNANGILYETLGNGANANSQTVRRYIATGGDYYIGTAADATPELVLDGDNDMKVGISGGALTAPIARLQVTADASDAPAEDILAITSQTATTKMLHVTGNGEVRMSNDLHVQDTITAIGTSTFVGAAGFTADSRFSGDIHVQDVATVIGTMSVTGNSAFGGDLHVQDALTAIGSMTVVGTLKATGGMNTVVNFTSATLTSTAFANSAGVYGGITASTISMTVQATTAMVQVCIASNALCSVVGADSCRVLLIEDGVRKTEWHDVDSTRTYVGACFLRQVAAGVHTWSLMGTTDSAAGTFTIPSLSGALDSREFYAVEMR